MVAPRIEEAMRAHPRAKFLPPSSADRAGVDAPLGIGYGQTNSQPSTVAQMLGWLGIKPGAHVLDVGSGSGWTTALLSYLAGDTGDIVAVELVPELVVFGRENCRQAGAHHVVFHQAGDVFGWLAQAPYDNILVSASADHLPDELLDQLASPGTLVIPVGTSIFVITKDTDGKLTRQAHHGYVFVPLLAPH